MAQQHDIARLSAYVDGDLDPASHAEVAAHLDCCEECRRVVCELRQLSLTAASLSEDGMDPSPGCWAAVERQVERHDRSRLGWRTFWVGVSLGATAVCVAMAIRFNGWPLREARGVGAHPSVANAAEPAAAPQAGDPMAMEAESQLNGAAHQYERSIQKLRELVEHEAGRWSSDARQRYLERLAGLDEAIARSRDAAHRTPMERGGHDMLFAAYHEKIQFLSEAVHRGAPAMGVNLP